MLHRCPLVFMKLHLQLRHVGSVVEVVVSHRRPCRQPCLVGVASSVVGATVVAVVLWSQSPPLSSSLPGDERTRSSEPFKEGDSAHLR